MILVDGTFVKIGKRYNDLSEDLQVHKMIKASKFKIEELETEEKTSRNKR